MKVAIFGSKAYDQAFFQRVNADYGHELQFFKVRLSAETVQLAEGFEAVCVFVNDQLSEPVLEQLAGLGVSFVALRCAGFNNVDLHAARRLGMQVVRVPAYSPESVAEHCVGLMLTLNRKYHRAWQRVREGNFSLQGLLGFNLHGKTVGLIGLGRIGLATARILQGFGMQVLAYDPGLKQLPAGIKAVELEQLYLESDIISLHCPLNAHTKHLINADSLTCMKDGVMLINTSRGGLVDSQAVINALKSGKLGSLGLDVYEQEGDLFFEDLSEQVIQDDVFERLLTFPNVLITGHQGFFTEEALAAIAATTLANLSELERGELCINQVGEEHLGH